MTAKPETPTDALSLLARIPWPISLLTYLLLLVIGTRVRAFAIANHDVAWLLVAAERWLGGATMGRDLVEINAPGALLIYVPPVWLAGATGLPALFWVNAWMALLAMISAVLVGRIVAQIFGRPADSRQAFLTSVMVGAVLMLYPAYDFAQRDHIVAILMLPYGIMAMASADFSQRPWLRYVAAALAALAVCIKPHYVLLLLVVFLVVWRRDGFNLHGFRQAIGRSNAIFIAGIGAAYVAMVGLAFGAWMTMALELGHLYAAYSSSYLSVLGAAVMTALLAAAAGTIATLSLPGREILGNLLLLALAALVLFVLQAKGWNYHLLPAQLFIWCGLSIMMVASLPRIFALSTMPLVTALAVLLVPAMLAERARLANGTERLRYEASVQDLAIRTFAKPGDAVMFFSNSVSVPFPLVVQEGYVWGSRYPGLWPLAGALALDPAEQAAAKPIIDGVVAAVVADIKTYRPRIIVVDEHRAKPHLPLDFDYLPLFLTYPEFAAVWRDYVREDRAGSYGYFVREQ